MTAEPTDVPRRTQAFAFKRWQAETVRATSQPKITKPEEPVPPRWGGEKKGRGK